MTDAKTMTELSDLDLDQAAGGRGFNQTEQLPSVKSKSLLGEEIGIPADGFKAGSQLGD